MLDLRHWNIAYSPSFRNSFNRLEEIHRLHNEYAFLLSKGYFNLLWISTICIFLMYKAATSWGAVPYGNQDSLEISYRDVHAMRDE